MRSCFNGFLAACGTFTASNKSPTKGSCLMRPPRLDQLDNIDRNLVASLQVNARESVSELARQLGIARTTVIARLARLEKTGVIPVHDVLPWHNALHANIHTS